MPDPTQPLQNVLSAFDELNRQDPNKTFINNEWLANEWLYGQRMSARLAVFRPDASPLLQLAVRAQHLCRWKIPRSDYRMDRQGYKRWRTDLARFHGDTAADVMASHGYSESDIQRVRDLLLKRQLKRDDEAQTLEDVACLVFLEFYLADFATKHAEDKLIDIIQKTWNKMSEKGHQAALQLPLEPGILALVTKALSPPSGQ